ncbi:MAG: serine/threonine-protein kinase [Polyangiaceae bacterium]
MGPEDTEWVSTLPNVEAAEPRRIVRSPHNEALPLAPGTTLAEYKILSEIGAGALGRVHMALDTGRNRPVALKTIRRPAGEDLFRLKREFRLASNLDHPNLVALYELVLEGPVPFFTMELVRGRPMTEHVAQAADPVACVRELLPGLFGALHALHEAAILHLDLKPANVLVDHAGRVVLLDFGLSSRADAGSRGAFDTPGFTPAYAPPERFEGARPSAADDWYALGVLLYESLTRTVAFPGPLAQTVLQKTSTSLPAPSRRAPNIPEDLDTLVMQLLSRVPEKRAPELGSRARGAAAASSRVLLGRTREWEEIERATDAFRAGDCVRLWLDGPPGVGKSALCDRLAQGFVEGAAWTRRGTVRALRAASETLVLRGACHTNELLSHNVFDGIIDELTSQLMLRSDEELSRMIAPDVGTAAVLFPVLAPLAARVGADVPHGAVRTDAYRSVKNLLLGVARRIPLVAVVDDVHWGDADSAELFLEVFGSAPAPPMLLVMSRRMPAVDGDEFIEEIRRAGAPRWLRGRDAFVNVAPLSSSDAVALARDLLSARAAAGENIDADSERIAAEARGLPALIVRHATAATVGAALSAPLETLLQVLAVAGHPIPQRTLTAATGGVVGPQVLAQAKERQLAELRRLHPDAPVALRHAWLASRVDEEMEPERRAAIHRALADALEGDVRFGAALAAHYRAAGLPEIAAERAARAGERAESALAYRRAAELFDIALGWSGWDKDTRSALLRRLAHNLVASGRTARGAETLALLAQRTGDMKLLREAAEHYLAAGFHREGMALLEPLVAQHGIASPRTTLSAVLGAASNLARVALLPPTEISRDPDAIASVDLCWSATRGLIATDFVRGAHFATEGLRRALALGDPWRKARAMAIVGATILGPLGGPIGRWGGRWLERAREAALDEGLDAVARARLLGTIEVLSGQLELVRGRFESAFERSLQGDRMLSPIEGTSFERNVGRMGALRAAEELGRFDFVRSRAFRFLQEANEAGDRYGALTFALSAAVGALAGDDPAGAEEVVTRASARWTHESFHIQHFYAARSLATTALYRGELMRARAEVERIWPRLERSQLLRVPVARIDALALRTRVDLAAVDAGEYDILDRLEMDASWLAREGRADARAFAHIALAGRANALGDRAAVRIELGSAMRLLDQSGLRGVAECAALALAELEGDITARTRARVVLEALGVDRPDAFAAIYVPIKRR